MITAKSVKELREMTGAGMMDCKKALVQTEGDIEKAVEYLREKGLAAAAKKAGRVAAEGIVKTFVSADKKTAGMVEVNCETDFVAANEEFVSFADKVAEMVANTSAANVEELLAEKFDGEATVQETLTALIAKLGENMTVRRFAKFNIEKGAVASYIHGGGRIGVMVEVACDTESEILEEVAREVVKEIGYDDSNLDMDYKTCKIIVNVSKQSSDIALGVDNSLEDKEGEKVDSEGAGDQGIMFGFACDETEELMPLPILLAHKLARRLAYVRKKNIINYLRPDGKVQVTIEYEDEKPIRVDTIVISSQHRENVDLEVLKKDIHEKVIKQVVPENLIDLKTKYFINPTGRFVIGGPLGDSGLTGRKIIVDTYGGMARHGGGAFSGKDATKVDRSAAYMARFIAKNIVANKLAKKCEIQFSYAIGVAKPVSIYVNTFGTSTISEEEIIKRIYEKFDLTPRGIINYLDLQKPIYRKTTNYGHFGKADLSWEKIIKL